MNHCILTRINFEDKDLMKKYIDVSKKYFIPSLYSQTSKKFDLVIMCKKEDEDYIRKEIGYKFIPIRDVKSFYKLTLDNSYNIQTRHDCDDWMQNNYIEMIQKLYVKNILNENIFLVQSQPLKYMCNTQKLHPVTQYSSKKCSMHLSLCQSKPYFHIYQTTHGQMSTITPDIKVFTLPGNPTHWVIHGENISVKKGSIKYDKSR